MISSRCSKCGLTQAKTDTCKRCGAHIEVPDASQRFSAPVTTAYGGYDGQSNQKLKSGLAIASFILALIALPTGLILIGGLFALIAIILGAIAYKRGQSEPTVYGGQGFAIAGIVIGAFVCLLVIPIILTVAIPNIYAAKRFANEASALSILKKVAIAQETYKNTIDKTSCGDIGSLAAKGLIEPQVASSAVNGYLFAASGKPSDRNQCEVTATPRTPSDGDRSFYYSSTDYEIRVALKGVPATRADQPLPRGPSQRNF